MIPGGTSSLGKDPLSTLFSTADKYIHRISKRKDSGKNLKIAKMASNIIKEMTKNTAYADLSITPKNIGNLSRLLFDLYHAKEKILHSKDENADAIIRVLEQTTEESLKVFFADVPSDFLRTAKLILEEMLRIILTDVTEEVVGQERPPGSILKMLATTMRTEHGIEDPKLIKTLAMALYPVALLAATYDSRVKIPPKHLRESSLTHDSAQFIQEYKSQFGREALQGMHERMFKMCLEQAWILKSSPGKK